MPIRNIVTAKRETTTNTAYSGMEGLGDSETEGIGESDSDMEGLGDGREGTDITETL